MATIEIADNDARVQYTQAVVASTTQLTIDFPFFDLDDINVIVTTAAGVDTTLSRGTGTGTFAVTGTAVDDGFSGGYITLGDNYSAGTDTFTIFRDIPVARTTDFPTSGPFNISSLNTELDKIIAIEQELETKITRTLGLAESDTSVSLNLPNLNTRKGTVLAFNNTTGIPEAGPNIGQLTTIAALSADISTLADIEDGTVATDAISDLAAISSDVTTAAGISTNISTVAGISSDVTAVAADATDIGTVSTNIASVNTVATNIADVITVANDLNEAISEIETAADDLNEAVSEIDTVAQNIANVNAVGAIDSDVTTVAGISANVTTVAGISADTTTVAGISANVTTVAGISANTTTVAGISSDVTTVAGISANVTTVAGDSADISTVAGISSDVSAVSAVAANVTTVANNLTDINSFANTYFISATAPSSPTEGDLWFDTTNDVMKVYDGSGFVNAGSSVNGTSERQTYTATSGQTTFAATYDAGYVDVYLNGVKLIDGTDFTATDGSSIVLASGAALNDTVDIVAYGTFDVTNVGASLTSLGISNHNNLTVDASGNIDVTGTITVGDSHTIGDDADDNLEIASSTAENIVIDSAGGTTVFKENGTEVVRLTGGALGVGTTNPATPIEISSASNTALRLSNTATNYWEIANDSNLKFGRGGTEYARIDSSGNVGIGSTSPQGVLDLGDGTAGTGIVWGGPTGTAHYGSIWSEYGTGSIVIGAGLKGSTSSSDFIFPYTGSYRYSAIELDNFSSDGIKFYTSGSASRTAGATATKTERMRIDSDGRVIHGSTSAAPSYGSINVIDPINVIALGTNSSSDYYAWAGYRNGTLSGFIYTTTTSTTYSTTSDYRLKENVTDITGATERLKQLNPVRFNFIADADTTVDGFLAHEVQDVVPEAITGTKDAMRDEEYEVTPAVLDDDGKEITPAVMGTRSVPDYQGIDQSKLVPLLVATIQELEARITALEAN